MLIICVCGVLVYYVLEFSCVTATDLVLIVTQMLRKHGVVGKFVRFFSYSLLVCVVYLFTLIIIIIIVVVVVVVVVFVVIIIIMYALVEGPFFCCNAGSEHLDFSLRFLVCVGGDNKENHFPFRKH